MANYWYLGPFRCEEELYLFIHEITPHLDRAGVSFHVPERTGVVSPGVYRRQAGEETAKNILKASGKDFVPVTRGEYIDRAVSLGFFPGNTKWDAPLTNGDAAVLIMKLKSLLERG
jgi:hypothetical protein